MSRGLTVCVAGVFLAGGAVFVRSALPGAAAESLSDPAGAEPIASLDSVIVTPVPDQVAEGTIFEIGLRVVTGGIESITGSFAGEALHFRPAGPETYHALAAAPVDLRGPVPVELDVTYASGASERVAAEIRVVEGDYAMERLTVAPEFGSPLPPELEARTDEEYARAMAVARAAHDSPRMWEIPFLAPRDTRVTSGFGSGRVFNGEVTSRHMGTDFAGGVGEPVRAPASGRVVLVDAFYYGGNVVYIDHGAGLLTGYLHLSEQNVAEGDVVEPGQVIGLVGATGRVTGPHLHWIVRYGETTVDGTTLLALQ